MTDQLRWIPIQTSIPTHNLLIRLRAFMAQEVSSGHGAQNPQIICQYS
ncbi:MAG: hypothetical protein ACXWJB_02735 [Limisphaerales bacterium]